MTDFPERLSGELIERRLSEMWDALSDCPDKNGPDYVQAVSQARKAEKDLRERLARQDRLDRAAPKLLAALKSAVFYLPHGSRVELSVIEAINEADGVWLKP